MARRTRTTTLVWLRRAVQSAFLLLFLYLFLETVYHPINRVGGGVKLFFQLDPLVMLTDWLASHALAAGMLLSVATLAVTFLFGLYLIVYGWDFAMMMRGSILAATQLPNLIQYIVMPITGVTTCVYAALQFLGHDLRRYNVIEEEIKRDAK